MRYGRHRLAKALGRFAYGNNMLLVVVKNHSSGAVLLRPQQSNSSSLLSPTTREIHRGAEFIQGLEESFSKPITYSTAISVRAISRYTQMPRLGVDELTPSSRVKCSGSRHESPTAEILECALESVMARIEALEKLISAMRSGTSENAAMLLAKLSSGFSVAEIVTSTSGGEKYQIWEPQQSADSGGGASTIRDLSKGKINDF